MRRPQKGGYMTKVFDTVHAEQFSSVSKLHTRRIETTQRQASKLRKRAMSFILGGTILSIPASPSFAQDVTGAAITASDDAAVRTGRGQTNDVQEGDIVVTAQKRTQSINDVPLSMTVASGEALIQRGISSTSDLAKIVPGLTAQPSPFNTPVYTMRGVGFYESTLSATPTVAVYTDEVPLPFSAMTKAAALDLERVEVLKGPQGTLFGQNTTGGAINYIAAKPTQSFSAGADLSYGRFSTADVQGFVSGPLADGLTARLAVRTVQSGDWQRSYVRPSDTLGSMNETQARLLFHWKPSDRLSFALNLNGWVDKSDTQAPQRVGNQISAPANTARFAITDAYPLAPSKARAADWLNTVGPLKKDDYFVQGSLRADFDITNAVTFTSISALQRYKTDAIQDFDGIALSIADVHSTGHINSFSQEVRLSGNTPRLNWVVGANYERDKTRDELVYFFPDSTTADFGPTINFGRSRPFNDFEQNITTKAAFANIEVEVLSRLRIQAGARYTDSDRFFAGCSRNTFGPDQSVAQTFELLQLIVRGAFTPIPPGGCFTLDANFVPLQSEIRTHLTEDNVAWRAGINYETRNNGLVYATVSKGYKSGSFPTTVATAESQFDPVNQESLLAYEVGFKQPLLDGAVQVNAAAFYYDYTDKQLRGRILDVVFGPLDALVQIPKSRIYGAEAELVLRPTAGLNLNVAASYIDTKIQEFTGFNSAGVSQNFAGSEFPYSPHWIVIADGQYDFPISSKWNAFVGGSLTHNSKTSASIGDVPQLRLRGYTVIDVRAGIASEDRNWRFQIWGRNVTDEYYWTNALQTQDGYVRFAARPVTYGATLSFRY